MTITLDIKPEVQAELARQAAANGRELEAHALKLLEEAVHVLAGPTGGGPRERKASQNLVEVCAMVKGMTDDVDFSRDSSTDRLIDLS
jgi:hypothetical protein